MVMMENSSSRETEHDRQVQNKTTAFTTSQRTHKLGDYQIITLGDRATVSFYT